jgi:hypothetical protein
MTHIQTNTDAGHSIVPFYDDDDAVWTLPEPWVYGRGSYTLKVMQAAAFG